MSQFSFVVKNASIRLKRYTLNALWEKLTAVFAQVVTITKTTCPSATEDVWYQKYTYGTSCSQGRNTCRFFENQACQWLSIRIGRILECLSLQSNLWTKSFTSYFIFTKLYFIKAYPHCSPVFFFGFQHSGLRNFHLVNRNRWLAWLI